MFSFRLFCLDAQKLLEALQKAEEYMEKTANFSGKVIILKPLCPFIIKLNGRNITAFAKCVFWAYEQ